jgi:hypothetical protein
MITLRDEFLSEEDLDLRTMTEAELYAYWDMWLRQAQATNDLDRHAYSHGVFGSAPEASGGALAAETGRPLTWWSCPETGRHPKERNPR